MKYSSDKEMDRLIRQLVREGWDYRHGAKHGRITHPKGRPTLTVAKSPGDFRSIQNFRSDVRKALSCQN